MGNALVAVGADSGRPFHRRAELDLAGPLWVDLGQVVGEVERGARTIRTMHHGDLAGGQGEAGVQRGDFRIAPVADLAQEDVAESGTVQLDLVSLHTGDVDHWHDAADHDRKLAEAELLQIFRLHRRVGGAKVDGAFLDLRDAGARADRLVVEVVAGFLGIRRRPLGHDRIDEAGTGAGDIGGVRSNAEDRSHGNRGNGSESKRGLVDGQHGSSLERSRMRPHYFRPFVLPLDEMNVASR